MVILSCFVCVGTSMKNMFVDAMDRTDIPAIPDGYTVSVAYICVLDIVRSLNNIFNKELFSATSSESEDEDSSQTVISIYIFKCTSSSANYILNLCFARWKRLNLIELDAKTGISHADLNIVLPK